MEIFLRVNNVESGPYNLSRIQQGIDAGEILPTDQAWYENVPDWISVWQLPGVEIDSPALSPSYPPVPSYQPADASPAEPSSQEVEVGCMPVVVSIFFTGLAALIICMLLLVMFGDTATTLIVILVRIASLFWVFEDAKALNTQDRDIKGFMKMAPGHWVLASFFAYEIAFPAYLVYRHRLKKADRARITDPGVPA